MGMADQKAKCLPDIKFYNTNLHLLVHLFSIKSINQWARNRSLYWKNYLDMAKVIEQCITCDVPSLTKDSVLGPDGGHVSFTLLPRCLVCLQCSVIDSWSGMLNLWFTCHKQPQTIPSSCFYQNIWRGRGVALPSAHARFQVVSCQIKRWIMVLFTSVSAMVVMVHQSCCNQPPMQAPAVTGISERSQSDWLVWRHLAA